MKIKQYFNTVDLPESTGKAWPQPLPTPSGERMAVGKEAIGGIGVALQQGASVVGEFLEEKRKLDESLEAANIFNSVRTKIKTLEVELAKNPNEETHVPALQIGINKITSGALSQTKSKNVQLALSRAFSDLTTDRLNAGQDFAFKTYIAKSTGQYTKALYDFQQSYISTPDPGERARIAGEAEGLIKSVATTLGRDPDEDLRGFQRDAISGAIKSDMVADPRGTLARLQAGTYKGLWEQDRSALVKAAEQLVKTQEAEEQKVRIDSVTKELMTRYGNDFDAMERNIADPQFLKDRNLTVQEAHAIDTIIGSQRQNYFQQKNQVYHKTGQEAFVRLEKRTLTPQQLSTWVAKDELTDEQGRVYLNALQAQASGAGGATTDNSLFIHRFNQIHAAGGNDQALLGIRAQLVNDARKGMFKHEDYAQLWNLTTSENQAVFNDDYFKMTDNWFKQQLGFQDKVNTLTGEFMPSVAPNPEAAQAYVRAKLELIKAYKENKDLRGANLFEKGVEILGGKKIPLTDLLSGKVKEPQKPKSPTVSQEAPQTMRALLPDPKEYVKRYGSVPLRDKQTGIAYKTDGKTWWEIKQ